MDFQIQIAIITNFKNDSMLCSSPMLNLLPSEEIILNPLSLCGLCEAVIITAQQQLVIEAE